MRQRGVERAQTYFICVPLFADSIQGTPLLVRFRTMGDTGVEMSRVDGKIPKNRGEGEGAMRSRRGVESDLRER